MEATADNTLVLPVNAEAGVPRLSIEHLSGQVTISGWDRGEISISSPEADEETPLEDLFHVRHDGNEVGISPAQHHHGFEKRFKKQRNFDIGGIIRVAVGLSLGASADLDVKVPYACDIKVRTASGDVAVKDVDGRLSLASASGNVELQSVAGNVLVKTASGDVEADDFAGHLGVRTMSGDMEVRAGELLDLRIGTASGDVDVTGRLAHDGEYEIQTVSGDVTLGVPGDTSGTAEIHTISGDISCRLPHESTRRGRREQRLIINGGDGPALRINTTSGDVQIREWPGEPQQRSERGAATQRLSQVAEGEKARVEGGEDSRGQTVRLDGQQPQQSSQMEILEAIERGELTVEEALGRLGEIK